ncbi:hypothetical protein AKO1_008556 [Acrasis kona]|uniref:Uncharacterized protein n=1 Tax=Acrasis kona TaxID=1008807 RepID=A0AAW2YN04_9EUKA
MNTVFLCLLASAVWCASPTVDPTTLKGKVMFGYQGWFNTPNDVTSQGFRHWSTSLSTVDASTVRVDMWPDTSEYNQSLLYNTGFTFPNGTVAKLFSSQYPSTIDLHFKWLYDYNLDGFFLQRFLSELGDYVFFMQRNRVIQNCMASAQKWGRTFAIEYDVSGIDTSVLVQKLKDDWTYVTNTLNATKSSRYLKQDGKPVVVIWALGYSGRSDTPQNAIDIANYFKSVGCFVIVGVPITWKFGSGENQPGFDQAYLAFDGITPWSVGRPTDQNAIYNNHNFFTLREQNYTQAYNKWFAPTLFPGFSWANMNPGAPFNAISRRNGTFFKYQADIILSMNSTEKTFVFIAMFDEVDEGTAMFKISSSAANTPTQKPFVTTSTDGMNLPSDTYLRLAGDFTVKYRAKAGVVYDPTPTPTPTSTLIVSNSGWSLKYSPSLVMLCILLCLAYY